MGLVLLKQVPRGSKYQELTLGVKHIGLAE
jgi:hypothetical protein